MLSARVRRDVLTNVAGSTIVALGFMWTIRYAAHVLDAYSLGLFLLSRRIADTLANVLQAGAPFAVRRSMAMESDPTSQHQAIIGGLLIVAIATSVALVVYGVNPKGWGAYAFRSLDDSTALAGWTLLLAAGLAAGNVAGSGLLATSHVLELNALQLLNTSGWTILAVAFFFDGGLDDMLAVIALGTVVTALSFAAVLYKRAERNTRAGSERRNMSVVLSGLSSYGLPRTVSPTLELTFFLVGPWLLRDTPSDAGDLIIAMTLLRSMPMLVQPAASVLGVAAIRVKREESQRDLGRGISLAYAAILYASALGVACLLPWTSMLVRLWLGDSVANASITMTATTMLAVAVPYTLFQGMKETIEMLWHRPRNLATLASALGIMVIVYLTLRTAHLSQKHAILSGYVVAIIWAAAVSTYWIREYLRDWRTFAPLSLLGVTAAVLLTNYFAWRTVAASTTTLQLLTFVICLVLSAGSGAMFFAVSGVPIIRDARRLLLSRYPQLAFSWVRVD